MAYITTREQLIDVASKHLQPFLIKCEDFDKFEHIVDKELSSIKKDVIVKCIEDFDEQLRHEAPNNWTRKKRIKRTVVCIFGKISFYRTLFIDEYGIRRYWCDELLGIPERSRFSTDSILWLLENVAYVSYGQTAKRFYKMSGYKVSKMAIWYLVQKEAMLIEQFGNINSEKISQGSICVEADGIFVAMQSPTRRKEVIDRYKYEHERKKVSFEIKCGCIYAGKIKDGNRIRRVNVDLIASVISPENFWKNMNSKISAEYVLEDLKRIHYASDAGGWCTNHYLDYLTENTDDVVQTIDNFHVYQAIWKAFPDAKKYDWFVRKIVHKQPESIINVLDGILPKKHGSERKKIKALRTYIFNNIDLIKTSFNLGTMEATHAYVWGKRMKHIGGAWTKRGAHAMAVLLAYIYSGKKPIAPKKCRIFTKQDEFKMDMELGKLGGRIANNTRIGQGYEPVQGKLPKFTVPPYIPWQYLPTNSL